MDEVKQILNLYSQLENDDSSWNIILDKEKMIWTGIGDARKKGEEICLDIFPIPPHSFFGIM